MESIHTEVTKNLYYALLTRRSQIPIFLGSSSWTKEFGYCLGIKVYRSYNVAIIGKNFFDQSIDSDVKRYTDIRKLTGQGEDYNAGCLLDYDYTKNHYRIIAADLSRQVL